MGISQSAFFKNISIFFYLRLHFPYVLISQFFWMLWVNMTNPFQTSLEGLGPTQSFYGKNKASHQHAITKGWIGTNYRRLLELEAFGLRVGLFSVPVISPIIPNVRRFVSFLSFFSLASSKYPRLLKKRRYGAIIIVYRFMYLTRIGFNSCKMAYLSSNAMLRAPEANHILS